MTLHIDGVFVETFDIKTSLDIEPYNTCLLDISDGIPYRAALSAFGLDESHDWKVSALEFYEQVRAARRFAIKKTYSELDKIASAIEESKMITTQSRVLMWKAEQITKDDKYLSDIIDRLQAKYRAEKEDAVENSNLKLLGYNDEPAKGSYYNKNRAH